MGFRVPVISRARYTRFRVGSVRTLVFGVGAENFGLGSGLGVSSFGAVWVWSIWFRSLEFRIIQLDIHTIRSIRKSEMCFDVRPQQKMAN